MADIPNLPLFDEVAASLREKKRYQKELSEQEVAQVMESVIRSLLAGQAKIKAVVPKPTVHIEHEVGTVSGNVRVEAPIKATITVDCALENDVVPQHLKLIGSNIKEDAPLPAKLALKALNLKQRVSEKLADPNQALSAALARQLQSRGVRLTETGLHFHERMLVIDLKGEPMSNSR
ncbi:hypothetical protein KSD_02340 [Ktedonobacter sp. SOSP1-85]|uniref:hypothetical protein n=1 Tax=Ktedonobacter sp. SOSP1-85 TaxID=2778367 RepID=UPI00191617F9|nr:hypothetical protein [Ktedonobacter sp. SOSP1-85]GHO72463.1 hypothetical protein KSD_02340 [Ktedonobacter sp. SOSP1-85]